MLKTALTCRRDVLVSISTIPLGLCVVTIRWAAMSLWRCRAVISLRISWSHALWCSRSVEIVSRQVHWSCHVPLRRLVGASRGHGSRGAPHGLCMSLRRRRAPMISADGGRGTSTAICAVRVEPRPWTRPLVCLGRRWTTSVRIVCVVQVWPRAATHMLVSTVHWCRALGRQCTHRGGRI